MATHDYVIDNGTGSAVRADLNNLFKAILTNNSGTTDPSTVISSDAGSKAFSFWADTNSSPAVLKIRNAADDGWIELFQLDGTLTLEDGSATAPALAFRDDLNTGIYSSAADTFNVTAGGQNRMELGSTTIFNDNGLDVDFRIEGDSEANLFYVDASVDKIGIGTSSPSNLLHCSTSDTTVARFESTASGGTGVELILHHSTSSPADNDNGGAIYFQGNHDGGSTHTFAYILTQAIDVSDGSEDATLAFATSVQGTAATRMIIGASGYVGIGTGSDAVDRMLHVKSAGSVAQLESTTANSLLLFATPNNQIANTIPNCGANDNDFEVTTGNLTTLQCLNGGDVEVSRGNLVIGTSGKGIDFAINGSATGMTSELLDDYEEGTWTPSILYQNNTGLTITTVDVDGKYTKIGRVVWFAGLVQWSVSGSPVNDNVAVMGLPFNTSTGRTALSNGESEAFMCSVKLNGTSDQSNDYFGANYGTTGINLSIHADQGNRANEIGGNSNMRVFVQGWYHTE